MQFLSYLGRDGLGFEHSEHFLNFIIVTLVAFTWVTNARGPHPRQQHAGLQHAEFLLHQEVTRPEVRL